MSSDELDVPGRHLQKHLAPRGAGRRKVTVRGSFPLRPQYIRRDSTLVATLRGRSSFLVVLSGRTESCAVR